MRTRAKTKAEIRNATLPAVRIQRKFGNAVRRKAKQQDVSVTDWIRAVVFKALEPPQDKPVS